jgi:hypothetical protein
MPTPGLLAAEAPVPSFEEGRLLGQIRPVGGPSVDHPQSKHGNGRERKGCAAEEDGTGRRSKVYIISSSAVCGCGVKVGCGKFALEADVSVAIEEDEVGGGELLGENVVLFAVRGYDSRSGVRGAGSVGARVEAWAQGGWLMRRRAHRGELGRAKP